MALPTDHQLMFPLSRHTPAGRQYSYADLVPLLQRDFRFSEAGLLTDLRRFAMKQRGVDTLESNPTNKTYLERIPEFRLYPQRSRNKPR